METLDFILNKYKIDKSAKSPVKLNCTRWGTLPRLFRQLGFKVGAEIGVAGGRFSKFLCQYGGQKVYAVDAWKIYKGYKDEESQEKMENLYKEAKNRLSTYNCQIIRDWSAKAVRRFANNSLDFVYLDANHSYGHTRADVKRWAKKVRTGGIVAGHDYVNGHHGLNYGVKRAVNEWVEENKIRYLFLLTKRANVDNMPSWFYVK